MVNRKKIEEEIKQVAYEIYVQNGCIPGRDMDNWLKAERIVLEKYGLIEREESKTESEVKETTKKKRECKRKTPKKASSSEEGKTKTTRKTKK